MYKLVILDLDGTTVASNGDALPSDRVIKAVKAAQKKVHISLATGRPYDLSLPVIKALGLHGPSVFNGGSEIVETSTGEVLKTQLISIEAMQELVKLSLPFGYKIYSDQDQYTKPITDTKQITEAASKFFIEAVKTADIVPMLQELAAVKTASAHPTSSWYKGDVLDIHVTHISGTKRHGVERLITMLDINKDEVIAIGDSHNDIPLLEAAGFKVAMGDAPSEVKAVADHIAPTLAEDGVADTLERFILNQS